MILVRAAIGGRSPGELLPMSALRAPNIDGAPPPTSALSYTGPLSSGAMRSRPSSPPLIRIQNTAPELKQYKVTPIYGSRPHGKYRLGRHTLRYITHVDEENRGGNEIPPPNMHGLDIVRVRGGKEIPPPNRHGLDRVRPWVR